MLSVLVGEKDGRGSYPQNRYYFCIDRNEFVTELIGRRELDYRERGRGRSVPIAPNFEDVLSIIIEAHRRQPNLKSS